MASCSQTGIYTVFPLLISNAFVVVSHVGCLGVTSVVQRQAFQKGFVIKVIKQEVIEVVSLCNKNSGDGLGKPLIFRKHMEFAFIYGMWGSLRHEQIPESQYLAVI